MRRILCLLLLLITSVHVTGATYTTLLMFLSLIPNVALAADYYASPQGSGSTCSRDARCSVQQCVARLSPGDRCLLALGRYTGASGMVTPRPGQQGGRVEAEQDGTVLLDGEFQHRAVLLMGGNSGWLMRGFNACCSPRGHSVISVATNANHNRFERMIAWDAEGHWSGAPWVNFGNTGNVFVDVAGWGRGRKAFGRIDDTDTVILRGFFMKNYYAANPETGVCHSDGGVGFTSAYKSRNSFVGNTIVTVDYRGNCPSISNIFGTDHYRGAFNWGQVHNWLLGNIAYKVDAQNRGHSTVLFQDAPPGALGRNMPTGTFLTTHSHNNFAIRREAADPRYGLFAYHVGPGTVSQVNREHWTDSTGSLQSGPHLTDAGRKMLQQFQNGLLQLDATSQPAFGAWIKHCYREDRNLDTGCHLWPWPMNQRIQEALRQSGYAERGLDGAGETNLTALIMRLTGSQLRVGGTPPGPIGPHMPTAPTLPPAQTLHPAPTERRVLPSQ